MRRAKQVIFKVTQEEHEKLKAGAKRARLRFSPWARSVLLREADDGSQEQGRPEPDPVPEVREG